MNAIQKKIQRLSKVVAVITKVLYIPMIALLCFNLIGLLWQIISPNNGSYTFGSITIVSPLFFATNLGIAGELFPGVAASSFLIAILILTNRIFKDIGREYSPFLPHNVKRIKTIALLLLIDSAISPPIDLAIKKSISLTVANSPDFSSEMIVLAVIIYCFALIFQYGAELQQQSDETL